MPEHFGEMLQKALAGTLFASRWLLAPFYLGIVLGVVILLTKFLQELWHLMLSAFSGTEADVILGLLSLGNLALTGSLLLIVIFSGYENFVSKIDHSTHREWPEWMGTIDFTALKLILLSSIVAISAIHFLRQELVCYVVIHAVCMSSSVLLALSDRISEGTAPPSASKSVAAEAHNGTQ